MPGHPRFNTFEMRSKATPGSFSGQSFSSVRSLVTIINHSTLSPICRWITLLIVVVLSRLAAAAEQVLTARLHHLRSGTVREWAEFPEEAEVADLRLTFMTKANAAEQTLRLRH